jgi:hypothetical protein
MRVLVFHGRGDGRGMMAGCAASTGLPGHDQHVRAAAPAAMSDRDKDTEILALRHQITILQRQKDSTYTEAIECTIMPIGFSSRSRPALGRRH